ncbi:AraC family transcriptional regulator [Paenibacillus sp.]|uniref:AraC family transcriptional regulator n=1 Tax=Paenibacillus sp. TaxID=58172 RepID=UPI002D23DE92|nr:AraC family transcriptional regulator [Paenibacillus sp.]HZG87824.1 AraC family transcriptional regulator [Paenibacillus sp.]
MLHISRVRRTGHYSMTVDHFHDAYEMYYLLEGERFYFIEGVTYKIRKGDLVLIAKYDVHKTLDTGVPDHERMLISFRESFLSRYEDQLPFLLSCFRPETKVLRLDPLAQRDVEDTMVRMLAAKAQGGTGGDLMLQTLFVQLLVAVVRACEQQAGQAETAPGAASQKIEDIVKYINANYAQPISQADLANRFYVSPSYLSRTFRKATGFSFSEYVQIVRVKAAQRLLRESGKRIIDIAEMSGFDSVPHFNRVFRKIMRTTPSQYRKSFAGKHPDSPKR